MRVMTAMLSIGMCLLAAGCSDPTIMLVTIDGTGARPEPLLVPELVDELQVDVRAGGVSVGSGYYRLAGPARPLQESITLLPGSSGGRGLKVEVSGLHDGTAIAVGQQEASFSKGDTIEVLVPVDWLESACLDEDGDEHGRGPACLGRDCDEGNPGVFDGAPESCNGVDDDCDEEVDEDLVPPFCELYKGVCRDARKVCGGEPGWLECTISQYGERYADVETGMGDHCDGFDNDCDGTVDEGCACTEGDTRPCSGPDEGACEPGVQTCKQTGENWVWGDVCDGEISPVDESCNEVDDDCDGLTDEDFDLQTDPQHCGACGNACDFSHADGMCRDGACVLTGCETGWHDIDGDPQTGCEYECDPAEPPEESCNEMDDDCDGATDEDFDLQTDPLNCGACGNDCTFAHGSGDCQEGTCVLTSCETGWYDIDDDPGTGCEYECDPTEPPDEACDNVDNDCDGETDEPPADADCDDGVSCTTDTCVQGECRNIPIDGDGDGYAPDSCGGDDCDDTDQAIHPGADEQCDPVDHDCDGSSWDVSGTEVWTEIVSPDGETGCTLSAFVQGPRIGAVSLAVSPAGKIGASWICDPDVLDPGTRAAVVDVTGAVDWSGVLIDEDRSGFRAPRVAAFGSGAFIVGMEADVDTVYRTILRVVDENGPQGSMLLTDEDLYRVDLEVAPWGDGDRVVALADIVGVHTPMEAFQIELQAGQTPAQTGSVLEDTGLETWCCDIVSHEMIGTVDGLVAVSRGSYLDPLQARWITGPTLAISGEVIVWEEEDGISPFEVRGAATFPDETSRRALVSVSNANQVDMYLADISTVGSLPLLASRLDLPYEDAAPVPVDGDGLAAVALTPAGEVVWLASDGDLEGLAETGVSLASGVWSLDARAVPGGRVAILMGCDDGLVRLQLRENVCAP